MFQACGSLTTGAHAQRGLRYLGCLSVCLSVTLRFGSTGSVVDGSGRAPIPTPGKSTKPTIVSSLRHFLCRLPFVVTYQSVGRRSM